MYRCIQQHPHLIAAWFIAIMCIMFPRRHDAQQSATADSLDLRVEAFLAGSRGSWRDMNISPTDGQILFDIIVSNNYQHALEIGTSTGHSGVWIAWALSKTGGKLITVEINERRHREALANFEEAGLSDYIDARLGDAHELVSELPGPFDFVFSDADKEWYLNYFKAVYPKLTVGGTFTAHNVSDLNRQPGISEYREHVIDHPHLETEIMRGGGAGISISRKISE